MVGTRNVKCHLQDAMAIKSVNTIVKTSALNYETASIYTNNNKTYNISNKAEFESLRLSEEANFDFRRHLSKRTSNFSVRRAKVFENHLLKLITNLNSLH